MNLTSPLADVIALLEPRTAELLMDLRPEVQAYHLDGLRVFLSVLEEYGIVLDPIERGERMHNLISTWVERIR